MTVNGAAARTGAWHQSKVSLIESCSWKYRLVYQEGYPDPSGDAAMIGTAVHAAIELHERQRLWARTGVADANPEGASVEAMRQEALVSLMDQYAHPESPMTGPPVPDASVEAANIAIDHWWEGLRPRVMEWDVYGVEPYWRRAIRGWEVYEPMAGWIDTVYHDGDEWVVVDNKTAAKMSGYPADGGSKRLQGVMYAWGALLYHGLPVDTLPRFEFHVMRTVAGQRSTFEATRVVDLRFDDADWQWLREKLERAQDVVTHERFWPNPDWYLCDPAWCPFYEAPGSPCPARPEGYSEQQTATEGR